LIVGGKNLKAFSMIELLVSLLLLAVLVGGAFYAVKQGAFGRSLVAEMQWMDQQHKDFIRHFYEDIRQVPRVTKSVTGDYLGFRREPSTVRDVDVVFDELRFVKSIFPQFTTTVTYVPADGTDPARLRFTIPASVTDPSQVQRLQDTISLFRESSPIAGSGGLYILSDGQDTMIVHLKDSTVSSATELIMDLQDAAEAPIIETMNPSGLRLAVGEEIVYRKNETSNVIEKVSTLRGSTQVEEVLSNANRFLVNIRFRGVRNGIQVVQPATEWVSSPAEVVTGGCPTAPTLNRICPEWMDVSEIRVDAGFRGQKKVVAEELRDARDGWSFDAGLVALNRVHVLKPHSFDSGDAQEMVGEALECPINSYDSYCKPACAGSFRNNTPWAEGWTLFGQADGPFCVASGVRRDPSGNVDRSNFVAINTPAGRQAFMALLDLDAGEEMWRAVHWRDASLDNFDPRFGMTVRSEIERRAFAASQIIDATTEANWWLRDSHPIFKLTSCLHDPADGFRTPNTGGVGLPTGPGYFNVTATNMNTVKNLLLNMESADDAINRPALVRMKCANNFLNICDTMHMNFLAGEARRSGGSISDVSVWGKYCPCRTRDSYNGTVVDMDAMTWNYERLCNIQPPLVGGTRNMSAPMNTWVFIGDDAADPNRCEDTWDSTAQAYVVRNATSQGLPDINMVLTCQGLKQYPDSRSWSPIYYDFRSAAGRVAWSDISGFLDSASGLRQADFDSNARVGYAKFGSNQGLMTTAFNWKTAGSSEVRNETDPLRIDSAACNSRWQGMSCCSSLSTSIANPRPAFSNRAGYCSNRCYGWSINENAQDIDWMRALVASDSRNPVRGGQGGDRLRPLWTDIGVSCGGSSNSGGGGGPPLAGGT